MDVKPIQYEPKYTADTDHFHNQKDQELDIQNCAIITAIKII